MKKIPQLLLAGLLLTSTQVLPTTVRATCPAEMPAPGGLSMRSVVRLLRVASDAWGVSLGYLILKYHTGDLTITYVETTPPSSIYMIQLDGSCILAALEDNL